MLLHLFVTVGAEYVPEQAVRFAVRVFREPVDHGHGDDLIHPTGWLMAENKFSLINVASEV
jgi:hypothetical protein